MDKEIIKIEKEGFSESVLKNLLHLPEKDIPKSIYLKGSLPDTKKYKFVSIVGSRSHSNYAKNVIEKLITDLSGYDVVIVSGLALGIDALALKYALENNLKTLAIPGSGLNDPVIYPKTNFKLSKDILNSGGCLLSEYEPDFKATMWSFPKRNRIMAGISDLTVVIEAGEKSGTLITARLATEYNKNLGVIPNSIFSEYSHGSNRLLRDGAQPIFSGKDILEILGIEEKEKFKNMSLFEEMGEKEKKIYLKLKQPVYKTDLIDDLASDGHEISEINELLSVMEIKGLINESLSKIYRR